MDTERYLELVKALRPQTAMQSADMKAVRKAFIDLVETIEPILPNGTEKTDLIDRLHRCAMEANVMITRDADGHPRASVEKSPIDLVP